ncbi:MAG TPA: MFS transporter [Pyrinomonadaceae bacterium]|jgi:MFS family permease|nr:MFS transporter [Pyrinomonadaceae bacterium]
MGDSEPDAGGRLDEHAGEARRVESEPRLWGRLWRLPRNVFSISLVSLFNDASSEIIYPVLPLFLALTLGATRAQIGLIEGAAESLSGLLKLFSGYFSDRRGRRKGMVVFGYGLASVVRPLIGFATQWSQVFAIRMADRFGKGVRSAPRDAMIADSAAPNERGLAFGFHRAMDHAGAVVGPLIAYAVLSVIAANNEAPTAENYKTLFLLAAIPALFSVLVAIFAVRETGHAARTPAADSDAPRPAPPRLTLRGFDSNFKRFLVILALFTLSNSTDAFLLLRAQQAGVSAALIPLLWAALHVSKVASSILGGDLSDKLGRKTMIVAGWALYAAVYFAFAFISTPVEAWIIFLVYGVYFGLTEGTEKALVADLVRPEQRGTAYGLYNLAFSISVLPASLLMGWLWDWRGAPTAFAVSAAVGLTSAILLAFTVRPGKMETGKV